MIVVGFGGNVGDLEGVLPRFLQARRAMHDLGVVRSAALYRSAPIGPEQPAFYNTAVGIAAHDLEPDGLMGFLLDLERHHGRDREREVRWGPRTLDLDILVWHDRVIHTSSVQVPHPRLAARRFALAPLVDLVGPDYEIPGIGRAGEALRQVRDQDVIPVDAAWSDDDAR
jgi:2-amino-4-hydroxy-6-hydroxymethyldihydropteridine diphosphokinase